MDLHAHLSGQPVHGLLGGTWLRNPGSETAAWPTAAGAPGDASCRWEKDEGVLHVVAAEMVREVGSQGEGLGGDGNGDEGSGFSACGMDPADAERAARRLRDRGLVCVGRYVSVPPEYVSVLQPEAAETPGGGGGGGQMTDVAAVAGEAAGGGWWGTPSQGDVEAQLQFQTQLLSHGPSLPLVAAAAADQAAGTTPLGLPPPSSPLPPCVCALLRPYQVAAGPPSAPPSWFQVLPGGGEAVSTLRPAPAASSQLLLPQADMLIPELPEASSSSALPSAQVGSP